MAETLLIVKVIEKTTGPISTKLGTKHCSVEGIKVFSNEGPLPSQRGDNSKKVII